MSSPALTADVVALTPASVLLIQRSREPFAGAWALPGGFVEAGERVHEAAARELGEETAVEGVALELLGVYDTPGRDPRGPTVSVAYLCRCDRELTATGGDDAGDARWFALSDLPPMAFDHAAIVADAISCAARGPRS